MWISLAAAHAGADDRKRYNAVRDRVAAKMNPTQIAEAQRLAVRWFRLAAERSNRHRPLVDRQAKDHQAGSLLSG
jgi:hypothetical protein